ncbi:alpha/beta fold hydrolase [Streptomyces afghaniensis]|uniref:alpha/beta fold hydrolase n=1 Tax=Streptomyces afghaniensis TaxID=66865 RepID=UPI0037A90029
MATNGAGHQRRRSSDRLRGGGQRAAVGAAARLLRGSHDVAVCGLRRRACRGPLLVLVDARGHGGSDAPYDVDSYRLDRQVGDVVAVLDALDIYRAAFWGASMGGIIGLNLLAGHPERLTALIAGGAHGERVTAAPAEVQQEIGLFRSRGTAPFIEMLERQGPLPPWMRAAMQAADPNALAALTAALDSREGVLERLVRTSAPVLLLAGDHDARLQSIRDTADARRGACWCIAGLLAWCVVGSLREAGCAGSAGSSGCELGLCHVR